MARKSPTRVKSRYDQYLDAVQAYAGEAPNNPFKAARLMHGLGVQEFADQVGVSKQAVIRQEQGCNPEPIAKTVEWVIEHGYYTYPDLINGYAEWQGVMRERHKYLFGQQLDWNFTDNEHPFKTLRSAWSYPPPVGTPASGNFVGGTLNITEVAKLLCLNQGTLDHWEQRVNHQAVVPAAFGRALRDNGYSREAIRAVEVAFTRYRQWKLNGDTDIKVTRLSALDLLKDAL